MPSTQCCVPGCLTRGGHTIPKDITLRKKWLNAIKRKETGANKVNNTWEPKSKSAVVCHFIDEDYIKIRVHGTSPLSRRLKKGAVPSDFSWTVIPSPNAEKRKKRICDREQRKKLCTPGVHMEVEVDAMDIGAETECRSEISVQTVNTDEEDVCETVLPKEICTQTPDSPLFCIEKYQNDPTGISYYTGLESYEKFEFVFQSLGPAAYHLKYYYTTVQQMSVKNKFFLTLIKLRRAKDNFELSRMFEVSETTVCNIFITWLNFMYRQWMGIDIWPERDTVKFHMPSDFKHKFPTTRVVVDGTEIPIKKPSAPLAQQATFSTYKNRNTAKVLVGATPGGMVSYVSAAYGGATSDRQIVERCTLIPKCDLGDSVMADKGFNVQDLFAPYDHSKKSSNSAFL